MPPEACHTASRMRESTARSASAQQRGDDGGRLAEHEVHRRVDAQGDVVLDDDLAAVAGPIVERGPRHERGAMRAEPAPVMRAGRPISWAWRYQRPRASAWPAAAVGSSVAVVRPQALEAREHALAVLLDRELDERSGNCVPRGGSTRGADRGGMSALRGGGAAEGRGGTGRAGRPGAHGRACRGGLSRRPAG